MMEVSSDNGLVKGVAFVPMVLERVCTLMEMVLKRGYLSVFWSWKGASFTC